MMKKTLFTLAGAMFFALVLSAQTVYTDAQQFDIYGKISADTPGPYCRLPISLEGVSREPVWRLGQQSAGIYVRFKTNSANIRARWTSRCKEAMNHMTDTGVRGIDLYIFDGKAWRFVGAGRPDPASKETASDLVYSMDGSWHECMIYLSLYDGVDKLEIGVDEGAGISRSTLDSPRAEKPVIVYGTSITQGGCVSRPGMCYTSILSRRLDRQFINLGFSGNGIIDLEIAGTMASYEDPGMFVLDYVGNARAADIEARGEKFFRILRDAHPDVPILFLGAKEYPYLAFNQSVPATVAENDAAQKALFDKLRKAGEKKIYYCPKFVMTGDACEYTVDGTHLTDLGVVEFTDFLYPYFRRALR